MPGGAPNCVKERVHSLWSLWLSRAASNSSSGIGNNSGMDQLDGPGEGENMCTFVIYSTKQCRDTVTRLPHGPPGPCTMGYEEKSLHVARIRPQEAYL